MVGLVYLKFIYLCTCMHTYTYVFNVHVDILDKSIRIRKQMP